MYLSFSVAFAVDPLYRQTSAKFDEGGAKGLLMNNLGVYGRCRVLFDSLDVPGKYVASQNEHDVSDTVDLSFARGMLLVEYLWQNRCHIISTNVNMAQRLALSSL